MNLSCLVLGLLLVSFAHSWCLKTTVNLTVEVSKLDYSPNGVYIAVTSIPANRVYIYETINFFLVFTYTPSGGDDVRTARFTRDGVYLGIGFDDGKVRLVPGQPPFSNSANKTISTQNKDIVDIDFNYGLDKLLVCFSDDQDFYVIKNYATSDS
jgi:WD40 repeat protein